MSKSSPSPTETFSQISLSEHERYLAQARMMRAELVADMVVSAWKAVSGLFRSASVPVVSAPTQRDSQTA